MNNKLIILPNSIVLSPVLYAQDILSKWVQKSLSICGADSGCMEIYGILDLISIPHRDERLNVFERNLQRTIN